MIRSHINVRFVPRAAALNQRIAINMKKVTQAQRNI
jgi:hypothetical protein